MEDYKILWYILAAVIYFLTRGKKKKAPAERPGSENNPSPQSPTKSFEDLLKEITGEGQQVTEPEPEPRVSEEVKEQEDVKWEKAVEDQRLEGERRAFADDESRKVYEESIKRAEGFELEYKPDEHYHEPRLFKGDAATEEEQYTFADEIRDGLSADEARKAIIYSEIMNRKY
ncbi:MAG: hypothetical protein ABJP45_03145 [Cyclobacteriaceae bacterium]